METYNDLKVEWVDIEEIKPYENNAKEHPAEQISQIKKSIQEFGFNDPLAIWKNKCVCGHGRLLAAKELGLTKLPIIRLDHLTD
jgi:ParB-like chromosome segregation protein Spo0J